MSAFSTDIRIRPLQNGNLSAFEAAEALTQLFAAPRASPGRFAAYNKEEQSSRCVSDDESACKASSMATKPKKQSPSNKRNRDGGNNKPEMFPLRLLRMLSDESVHKAITWLPRGESFVVLDTELFASSVLPVYFPESGATKAKYPSFTRKLNRWGFRQVNRGLDAGAFHHPLFRRDEPGLCAGMQCQKSAKSRRRADKVATTKEGTSGGSTSEIQSGKKQVKLIEFEGAPTTNKAAPAPRMSLSLFSSSNIEETPLPRRVPLKKRKHFSMPLIPAAPSQTPAASVSETPLLPTMAPCMPRRVSSFIESTAVAPPVPPVENYSHPQLAGQRVDSQSTLHQLQASMERAKAAKLAAQQRARVPTAVPILPRPAPRESEQRTDVNSAETHKSMLYKAYLEAMQL